METSMTQNSLACCNDHDHANEMLFTIYLQAIGGESVGSLTFEKYREVCKASLWRPRYLFDASVTIGWWALNAFSRAVLLFPVAVVWLYLLSLVIPVDPSMQLPPPGFLELPAIAADPYPESVPTPLNFLTVIFGAMCFASLGADLMRGNLPRVEQALERQVQRELFKSLALPRWPVKAFYKDVGGYVVPIRLGLAV